MSKPLLILQAQGRFGNVGCQFLFCRAFAEQRGYELRMDPWIGERVFDLMVARPDIGAREVEAIPTVNEISIFNERSDRTIFFRGYAQTQDCVDLYSKVDAKYWLRLRPEITDTLAYFPVPRAMAHRRVGDYIGYLLPVVSRKSYLDACEYYCIDDTHLRFSLEEDPRRHPDIPDDISFIVDFYCMMKTPTLLRGNSSYSWLAALLGNGLVLSPVIDGLEGGKEHDNVSFVPGNWPRLQNFDFTTEMRVRDI